jgi:hypothetical protein
MQTIDIGYSNKLIADEGKEMVRIVDGVEKQRTAAIIINKGDPVEAEWFEVDAIIQPAMPTLEDSQILEEPKEV